MSIQLPRIPEQTYNIRININIYSNSLTLCTSICKHVSFNFFSPTCTYLQTYKYTCTGQNVTIHNDTPAKDAKQNV